MRQTLVKSKEKIVFVLFVTILVIGCRETYTPKPRGYFRIDFPEKEYHQLQNGFPYFFEIPDYSKITNDRFNPDEKYWINISIPANRAEIHISYYDLNNQLKSSQVLLNEFMEETRELAYKHIIKADAIQEP